MLKLRLSAVSWSASLPALLLACLISLAMGMLDEERRAAEEKQRVLTELALVRARVEGVIKATFNSTDGLVNLIALQGGIQPAMFRDMARLVLAKNPHVRNITLAPDDVVSQVFPVAGNEKVIGFAFASRPEQYQTVVAARELQQPLLAGPVNLVQGGRALVQRAPVFVGDQGGNGRYWGTVSIVAYIDGLLQPGGQPFPEVIRVAIRGKDAQGEHGEMVDGDPALFAQSPLLMEVSVPGGSWQLGAIPQDGWRAVQPWRSPYTQLGLAIGILLALLFGMRSHNIRLARIRNQQLEQEIAERRRIEVALREEEERFRVLFESAPDPAWIVADGHFVRWNQAAIKIMGFSDASGDQGPHPAQLSPDVQPDGEASYVKAERMMAMARAQGVHRFDWVHRRCDGTLFPAEVSLQTVTLGGREVLYAVVRDISVRRQAEDELRASRNLLQAIVESAGAVIYVFDREERLLLCNQQFEETFRIPREKMLGQRRCEFMPEAVALEHEDNDRQVIATGRRTRFEERNQEHDGLHYYLTIKCPVFDGDMVRGVVGISTDITERRRNEEQLKLAAAILASTSEGVVITDVKGSIVAVNKAFTAITGYSEAEALGRKPNMLRSEHQGEAFYAAMWTTLAETGAWQGEIWNRRKNGEAFPEWLAISAIRNDAGQITHYVGVFSDISSLKHSQARLEHLAHFDPLTDLPNRVLFQDRLAHAIDRAARYEHGIALLLLDLDGFKTVNDSLGHPVGDKLLIQVAQRLAHCVRVEDTVARLGGDEFALILANMTDAADAIEVVRKILTSVEQPFDLDGTGALISASIGIAVYPADGGSAIELVRNADAAMYGAKEAGRNTYCFYQGSMTLKAQARLHLEAALRRGIEQREFEVWFQPQISLKDGRLLGAEALVRWRDPERGLIPPLEFIPLAERTGLILPLGELVLAQVGELARCWLDAGLDFGRLAVNVATPQLERSDYATSLRDVLQRYRLPPSRLEIEITESFIMSNPEAAREALLAIRDLGVCTSVDDFGTGYSSLAYLKDLPIDSLKIDRAFVRDLPQCTRDAAINRAIIAMAHSLGFEVVAEGIETAAQQAWLADAGCDAAQGFHIARPMPARDFTAWLRAQLPLQVPM